MLEIKEVIAYFDTMFLTNGKGTIPFEIMEKILETQALFPNLDFANTVYLWRQCESKKPQIRPDVIARYESFLRLGAKINLGTEGIKLREYVPSIKKYMESTFFDISQTDLPHHLSRRARIKEFTLDDFFLKKVYADFIKNYGYTLEQSDNGKIAVDREKKILKFPIAKEQRHTFHHFIKGIAFMHLLEESEAVKTPMLLSKEAQEAETKNIEIKALLIANAIMPALGVSPRPFDPEIKKNYIWGPNLDERIRAAEQLAYFTQEIVKNIELEKNFNIEYAAQQTKKINKSANDISKSPDRIFFNKEEYYQALKNETDRLKEEILAKGDIYQIVSEATNDIKKSSLNEFKANCILPGHTEDTPSFTFNVSKNMYHCFGCGEGGDIIKLKMELSGLGYPEAIKSLAAQFNIPTRFDELKHNFSDQAKEAKKQQPKTPKEQYLEKHPEDKEKIEKMTDIEFKKHMLRKEKALDTSKHYGLKPQRTSPSPRRQSANEPKTTKVVKTEEVHTSPECVKYLAEQRGITKYPKELRYIEGEDKRINEDGSSFRQEFKGVGYLNESGGADIRLPRSFSKEEQWKKTRSVGDKDIVLINKALLASENPIFVVSESGWDYAAAFNQPALNAVLNQCVGIITNGAAMVDKTVEIINKHKGQNSKIIFLSQADDSNLKSVRKILLDSALSDYARIEYTLEEVEEKADVNDLHVKGIDIATRFYGSFEPVPNARPAVAPSHEDYV